ncbi:MAG TPA: NAD(P)H-dependent oxidoreductase [Gaiellaceae bacterium]|nr:NAD(P)H-dependent oxidoreductase [Gaiellaceae bacterium]
MDVLAISGSLRRESYNTRLLRSLAEEAPEDVTVELWDGLKAIPPYDADDDGPDAPRAVEDFRERVRAADAVLIATPEYNASIPGALKNALDWASRPLAENAFRNKPVAVIASSTGMFGAVWAAAELRKVLSTMGARVADVELAVPRAHERFDDEGALLEDEIRVGLRDALATLVESAAAERAAA